MVVVDKHLKKMAQYQKMSGYCGKIERKKILVVGDLMVDEYIWGNVRRISPEAPVPVVWVKNETTRLGGAGNVVNNLRSLDAEVVVAGVVGEDELGRRLIRYLAEEKDDTSGIIQSPEHQTIRKTRIVAHNQQVVRVDRETIRPISASLESRLIDFCRRMIKSVDAVIISDYDKGVVTRDVAGEVIRQSRKSNVLCTVDPKVGNIDNYRNCSVITPNHHEALQIAGITGTDENAIAEAGAAILKRVRPDALLITCGELGMALFEKPDSMTMEMIETVAQGVYDVTGAGDTAISALTLAMAAGIPLRESAIFANFAAGVVVGKFGTATTTLSEIDKAMKRFSD